MLLLTDIQPGPQTSTCRGVATRAPSCVRVAWSHALEDRPRCPPRHPPYESEIKPHVPTREVHPRAAPASNTHAGPKSFIGNESCRHRRNS
jgi:hypothetical protein